VVNKVNNLFEDNLQFLLEIIDRFMQQRKFTKRGCCFKKNWDCKRAEIIRWFLSFWWNESWNCPGVWSVRM